MDKKRLLYIMGIDWEWIYQRPQILAQKLSRDYRITVVFPRSVLSANRKLPSETGIEFRILWTIPLQEKNTLIGKSAMVMNQKLWRDLDAFEMVYVGYPLYARYIPTSYCGKIIYDCMDNHEMLYPYPKGVDKVVAQEKQLIQRCDLLLTSAIKLQEKMDKIAGYSKSRLLRNGTHTECLSEVRVPKIKEKYTVGYVGTIAEWFDFSVLLKSLDRFSQIEYHLVGPALKREEQERIIYHGCVEHHALEEVIKEYDCLIMPFQVNEIVAYVDPVKLYEYIASGKCIISVYYPEIERFRDFVYFYRDSREYMELMGKMIKEGFPAKYDKEQQKAFLLDNSWDMRYRELRDLIQKITFSS